jgi:hydroxyacylglutathione hydrolase
LKIIYFESGLIPTNVYVVYDEISRKCVVIDVPMDSYKRLCDIISENNLQLDSIILTHSHFDHTADALTLQKKYNSELLIHEADEYRILFPNENSVFPLPFKLEPAKATKYLNHLETLEIGNMKFEIRHTPGHTEGSICIFEHESKIIFSGDTIFREDVGRTDLPGGDINSLEKSIKEQILIFSDDYKIYSGHGRETTIGNEKLNNLFIRGLC